MNKTWLAGGGVLLVVAIACIAHATVRVCQAEWGMGDVRLWGSVAFHATVGACGVLLLHAACRKKPAAGLDAAAETDGGAAKEGEA